MRGLSGSDRYPSPLPCGGIPKLGGELRLWERTDLIRKTRFIRILLRAGELNQKPREKRGLSGKCVRISGLRFQLYEITIFMVIHRFLNGPIRRQASSSMATVKKDGRSA